MNQEKHWNTIGSDYDDTIFDVFNSDIKHILKRYVKKFSNPNHTVIDFGCGTGKAFPLLTQHFKNIIGTDLSVALLKQAKARNFPHVEVIKADLSKPLNGFPQAEFAFCCNVIMLQDEKKNFNMLQNIYRQIKSNGHAMLIVPSMESMLFANMQLVRWYEKEGKTIAQIPSEEFDYFKNNKLKTLLGYFHIDHVPTKHFLKEEMEFLCKQIGFDIMNIEKVSYSWQTEFAKPPKWLKDPGPWDWLFVLHKA